MSPRRPPPGAARLDVYPVTWTDEDGVERNRWSLNSFTGEIEPDPEGGPLYTTEAPPVVSGDREGTSG